MKLHHAPASPFVRKVMVTAHELGIVDQIEIIHTLPIPTDTHAGLAADNPLAKIPALILDDGHVLYDSRLITAYLDDLAVRDGRQSLVPAEGEPRWMVLRHEALCDGMLDAAVLTRYERAMRPEEKQWDDWADAQMSRVTRGLDYAESTIEYWAGDGTAGLASIATGCVCGYLDFRFDEFGWRNGRPKMADWFDTFSQRPSMQATVPSA